MNAIRRSIQTFFFSFFYDRLTDLRFLLFWSHWPSFHLKDFNLLAKINHVLCCSLSRELPAGRACLRTTNQGAALQLQVNEPKERRVAQCGLRAQARKLELKSSPGPTVLPDMKHLFRSEVSWCDLTHVDLQLHQCTCLASAISSFSVSEFTPSYFWTHWMLIDRQMEIFTQRSFDHQGKTNKITGKKRVSKSEKSWTSVDICEKKWWFCYRLRIRGLKL